MQQRLYSPSNHISPGKSAGCLNKRPMSSASATTPPCGVLKNVMVSHHMDRSSSTPRLTLKFHHVKRHENGIATAADVSPLRADSVHLPVSVTAGSKGTSSISCVDRQYSTASLPTAWYHAADAESSESHHLFKNSFERPRNSVLPAAASFSPQFEDISDAEDDVRPALTNARDSVRIAPACSLPPPTSQYLQPMSSGLYAPAASSAFCTSVAITTSASYMSPVSWNSYSGVATTLPMPAASVVQSSSRTQPLIAENHARMGAVGQLSPVLTSTDSSRVTSADALRLTLTSRQPVLSSRFAGTDGIGCLQSEPSSVTSEIQTDKYLGRQTNFRLENCNSHIADVRSDSYIKAEMPSNCAESSREPVATMLERKPSFSTSQSRSKETILSNSDGFVTSRRIREDGDDMKTDSRDSESSFRNSLDVKLDLDGSSHYSPFCHSPSVSSSLQTSCLGPAITNSCFTSSASLTADVVQIANNLEPKVPPLRIVIPSKVCSSGSLSDSSNASTTSRCGVGSLPYVVNRTRSADSDVVTESTDQVHRSDSSPAVFVSTDTDRVPAAKDDSASSELVPAKRRKIKHSSKVSACVDDVQSLSSAVFTYF